MSTRALAPLEVIDLVTAALERNRTGTLQAASVARALVAAEVDGQGGHGLSRVAGYAAQARVGKVDGFAMPHVERTRAGALRIDAAHGFAYPAIDAALDRLPAMARDCGIAMAGITRSHHCGAMGLIVEKLAEAGCVALMVANTPAAIAPFGGRRPLMGTNPIAFATPLPDAPPVVIDMALSKVARGKIAAAAQKGEPIPEGWALDADGAPTTDAKAALAGTMVPIGDAKGTALALMVEWLAAGLTGATFAGNATSFLDDKGGPPATGQLLIAIDPTSFGDATLAHMADLAAAIDAEPGARLPGTRRWQQRARVERDGLVLPVAMLDAIAAL